MQNREILGEFMSNESFDKLLEIASLISLAFLVCMTFVGIASLINR